ncbi:MAG: Xaa-Pro peptidase family protein [Gemmatimonadaceae bacterium]
MRRTLLVLLCSLPAAPLAAQVPAAEYAARRDSLTALMSDDVLLALGGHEPAEDFLNFYPVPSFYYLTGVTEPAAALVIVKLKGTVTPMLFVQPRELSREAWTGTRLGIDGMRRATGVTARPIEQLLPVLDSLLTLSDKLAVVGDLSGAGFETRDEQLVSSLRKDHPNMRVENANGLVARLRMRHSAAELALERKAIDITMRAQRDAIAAIRPGVNEFEIQALIEYTFRRNGADRPSFATIVGSGPNTTALHYSADDRFMQAGDLVVMDIGASYRGYAADVTRTVPVSGTFTPEQRAIYQLVRDAQHAAELTAKIGATYSQMDAAANRVLGEGLSKLGLIESANATFDAAGADCSRNVRLRCRQLSLFYYHALGHAIGLEVHDPTSTTIAPGNTFTIEPGIYVRATLLDNLPDTPRNRAMIAKLRPVVQRYADIGVRIEDDYFATENGVEWISRGPREANEIELIMRTHATIPSPRDTSMVNWYRQTEPVTH